MLYVLTIWVISLGVLLYVYGGYLVLLLLLKRVLFRKDVNYTGSSGVVEPKSVTVIVAAHNEVKVIAARIKNILECDYAGPLEIIIVSDGSRDGTVEEASAFAESNVRVLEVAPQKGRANAHNLGASMATGEILLFTDAETVFQKDFIRNIIGKYDDPMVGLVSGELGWFGIDETSVSSSMGLYWKYELALRRTESALGILAVGTGACISIRSYLYTPIFLTEDIDCVLPLEVITQGFRVLSEPSAMATDMITQSVVGEVKARTRMVALDVVGFLRRKHLLNPLRHPGIALSIFSHKLLRWLSPFFILANLLTSWILSSLHAGFAFYWYLQVLLVLLGGLGLILEVSGRRLFPASQVFSFIVANIGFFLGMLTAICGIRISKYSSAESVK